MQIAVHKRDKWVKKVMARGAPRQLLNVPSFDLDESVFAIDSQPDGYRRKTCSKKKQIGFITKLLKNPFGRPLVHCIASEPNDSKAGLLALFLAAHASYKIGDNLHHPYWHTVKGGYVDDIRDKKISTKLLIISNVPSNSTPNKLEKVRDILEIYSDIPRIVVTTGEDPLSFFNTKLKYVVNGVTYLSSRRKVIEI